MSYSLNLALGSIWRPKYRPRYRKDETENELLAAVTQRNRPRLQRLLSNLRDWHDDDEITRDFQLAALVPAIENSCPEILEELLKNEEFRIGRSVLLIAVRAGSKECVKIILNHINYERGDVGPETIMEGYFINPLMVAINLKQYDIIDLLVKRGYRITKNRTSAVDKWREEGKDAKSLENIEVKLKKINCGLESSLKDIHYYRARTDPIYMAYTYIHETDKAEHPLLQIFNLNRELLQREQNDFEFNREYEDLSKKLGKFAVDLLEECHKVDEIKALTNVSLDEKELGETKKYIEVKSHGELSFLNFAIRRENIKLVAHPYSQLLLNEVLYQDIYTLFSFEPPWRERSFLSRTGYSLRHTLLLPFFSLMFLFFPPNSTLCKSMRSPFIKFHSYTGSLCIFVALLMLASVQDKFADNAISPTALDWLILAWVLGLVLQETKEVYGQGVSRYINQWWNIVSFFMLLLFVISYILRLTAYVLSFKTSVAADSFDVAPAVWFQMALFSNAMFSFAMILSFVHLSSAFQVSEIFGPMQLSLYKILVDVLKFMVFFFTLFMAFGFSLRRLYSQYISTQNHLNHVLLSGEYNGTNIPDTKHPFADVFHSLYSLYWSVFGMTNLSAFATNDGDYQITTRSAELLFGLFQILMVIIAINMLIAMMSRSYEAVAEDNDNLWKMSRTMMWMDWVNNGNSIPPPFNILKVVLKMIKKTCSYLGWITKKMSCKNAGSSNEGLESIYLQGEESEQEDSNKKDAETRKSLQEVMKRYLSKCKNNNARENVANSDQKIKSVPEDMKNEPGSEKAAENVQETKRISEDMKKDSDRQNVESVEEMKRIIEDMKKNSVRQNECIKEMKVILKDMKKDSDSKNAESVQEIKSILENIKKELGLG